MYLVIYLKGASWMSNCADSDNCLCCGFMDQPTQWGHVERGQFT